MRWDFESGGRDGDCFQEFLLDLDACWGLGGLDGIEKVVGSKIGVDIATVLYFLHDSG